MRKQYHFRPSKNGFYAWDVDCLIELTKNLDIQEVQIDSIQELDEDFWFSNDNITPTCRVIAEHAKLINEAELKYPIILSSNGRVMDGMHRISKATMLGSKIILAVKFLEDPIPNYTDVYPDDLPY